MSEIPICNKCNKPLFTTELTNTNSKTWCNCDKIGVPDGWSGAPVFTGQRPQQYQGKRR